MRQKNAAYLTSKMNEIDGVETLKHDPRITSNSVHIFIWRYKKEHFKNVPKDKFIKAMQAEIKQLSPGYSIPLYDQPVFKNKAFGPRGKTVDLNHDYTKYHLPETEKACYDECIWINQNMLLGTEKDMSNIIEAIVKIKDNVDELL